MKHRSLVHIFIPIAIIILGLVSVIWLTRQPSKPVDTNSSDISREGDLPTNTIEPNLLPEEDKENEEIIPKPLSTFVNYDVPFTAQAPTGDWSDERQQDGCEEASALMAMAWVKGEGITNAHALEQIIALSDYEQAQYGEFRDISLADIKQWIFEDYFKYSKIEHQKNISAEDIITALQDNSVVLLPLQGQRLGNPYFSPPGPERHMLLVKGYDPKTGEFITNDPGTRRGADYRYSVATIMNAILVYPTGHHEPANESLKEMLVVKK